MFEQSAGLVTEGDIVSLSAGLHVHGLLLVDEATGVRHRIASSARMALELLKSPILLEDWINNPLVKVLGTGPSLGLLLSLDDIAGLTTRRPILRRLRFVSTIKYFVATGILPARSASRYTASWHGLVKMILRASLPIITSTAMVAVLAYGANISMIGFMQTQTYFLLSLLVSTALHEAVHWRVAGQGVFVRRGLRIGLLHAPLHPRQELTSALGGPLVGVLVSLFYWTALAMQGTSIFGHLSLLLVAVFHMCSWLPWYGDGQVVWGYRRRYA